MSGEQELGITESKEHSPGEWYAEVVQKAGLADYGSRVPTRPPCADASVGEVLPI